MAKVDITDIAPGKGEVTIGDSIVEVRGLSLHVVADIIGKYPVILGYMQNGGVDDPLGLLASVPDAAIEIMAAGLGRATDAATLVILRDWEMPQQTSLLTGILNRTFRGSAGPFVRALLAAAAMGARAADRPGAGQISPSTSPVSSNG